MRFHRHLDSRIITTGKLTSVVFPLVQPKVDNLPCGFCNSLGPFYATFTYTGVDAWILMGSLSLRCVLRLRVESISCTRTGGRGSTHGSQDVSPVGRRRCIHAGAFSRIQNVRCSNGATAGTHLQMVMVLSSSTNSISACGIEQAGAISIRNNHADTE